MKSLSLRNQIHLNNILANQNYLWSNNDIGSIQQTTMYNVRPIRNYNGPKIDWNGEELALSGDSTE